jgi:fumarate hydratase class II
MASDTTRTRFENDSFGAIAVEVDRYWGAQTERSRQNFPIGDRLMPLPIIHALGLIKQAAAEINTAAGALSPDIGNAIAAAAREVADGHLDNHFPLVIWQTGSGTQTNMNVNEVVANRANEMLGAPLGARAPVHPNDHVNLGQSSNDSFPTAIHIAAAMEVTQRLLPVLKHLQEILTRKATEWASIVKIGRTHLQDATPITLGQEFSGYAAQVALGSSRIREALADLFLIAQGGTAVGTGLNARPGFAEAMAERLAGLTGLPLQSAPNKFEALASHDSAVHVHGALTTLSGGLYKIACDIRLAGSGPRAGFGELRLPENEPGSSIMPGKVNPTQIEALTMVCARVFGNETTIVFAGSQGHFELNVMKPVVALALLESIELLADATRSFTDRCVAGLEPEPVALAQNLERSLMLVTALVPKLGYDKAAEIAKTAHANRTSLREEAERLAGLSSEEFDRLVRPEQMLAPH